MNYSWSGNTEFMNAENSYLLDYELVDVKDVDFRGLCEPFHVVHEIARGDLRKAGAVCGEEDFHGWG